MTTPPINHKNCRGAALVLILGSLILLSILIIAFLFNVRQDMSSSAFYASGASTRQLADITTNLVIAQLTDATADPDVAWISQPGLLRTFDSSGSTAAFKLYSSDTMKINGSFNPADPGVLSSEVPSDWYQPGRQNEFVDLNKPVTVNTGATVSRVFPIVDPAATSEVEGFSYANAPADATGTRSDNPLPMPVRWIYILDDGSFATWAQISSNSNLKPVGRVAFWADDECNKVNINTAAGGVYYDSPAVSTKEDYLLGRGQPVAQEYQRWPGHPSTTSLAAVLKALRNTSDEVARSQKASDITPRIAWGGTKGNTVQAWAVKTPVDLDQDRLYTSVDELLFNRTNPASSSDWFSNSMRNSLSTVSITPDTLSKTRFFLTANSLAPELNALNRPRVTLWPYNKELIDDTSGLSMTPEDRLIKFSSELGSNKRKLYFQRQYAWDATNDYANIESNKELYAYLRYMTKQVVPAAKTSRNGGDTLEHKFGMLGRDQILTQMFDYLRSLTNTMNQAYKPLTGKMSPLPVYSFPQGHTTEQSGYNDVAPIIIPSEDAGKPTKGFGQSVVPNEVILQFYNAGERFEGTNLAGSGTATDSITWVNGNATPGSDGIPDYIVRRVQMILLIDFFASVNSLNTINPRIQVKVTGLPFSFAYENVPLRLASNNPLEQALPFVTTGSNANVQDVPMGFPNSGAGFVNILTGNRYMVSGGRIGLSWNWLAPGVYKTGAPSDTPNPSLKAGLTSPDQTYTWKRFSRAPGYENFPFYSDVVEFRIPNTSNATSLPIPFTTPVVSKNYHAQVKTNPITITIYPALLNNATDLTSMQPSDGSVDNYLTRTTISFDPMVIPLPRLGPFHETKKRNAFTSRNPAPNFPDLADYTKRVSYRYSDSVALVPEDLSSNTAIDATGENPMDVFRAYSLAGNSQLFGDLRLAAVNRDIPSNWWEKNPMYGNPDAFHAMTVLAAKQHAAKYISISGTSVTEETVIRNAGGSYPELRSTDNIGLNRKKAALNAGVEYAYYTSERTASASTYAALRRGAGGNSPTVPGDFTTGFGFLSDGGFVKGADIGNIYQTSTAGAGMTADGGAPYFGENVSRSGSNDATGNWYDTNFHGLMFSPFKTIPSAVMFGTMPSRALDNNVSPWETLLFNPNPAGGRDSHRGWAAPRDHYWLDLFYMPVVEPYAITENFATAGKINMNFQIAPFTYIERATGVYALLRDLKILAVPRFSGRQEHKRQSVKYQEMPSNNYRMSLNIDETLKGFRNRFSDNDPFVTASEICEMYLIPSASGVTFSNVESSFWDTYYITSDDKREAPYNALYPRVTTKSNTFQVHFWVQSIKTQRVNNQPKINVTGEYRGSAIVERYLNMDDTPYGTGNTPDTQFPPLAGVNSQSGKSYYKYRTINAKQFAP